MNMKEIYYIWLNSKLNAGSISPKILLERLQDIEKIYKADADEYESLGISDKDIKLLCDKGLDEAKRYYDYCIKEHIGILCYDSEYYPGRLRQIPDPPAMFYYKGRPEVLDDHLCIAMVGTRKCSENGFRYAYRLGYKAAERGAVLVNGLASGCDAAALYGALDADGYCVGLLGNGIDRIYPAENKELFKKLERRGLILSEFPPFTKPLKGNFPVRNRIISALSLGTVILECETKSGALITADHAKKQGRKIYAVPGDISDPLYGGPLSVIKSGAKVITDADDVISEYELMFPHRITISENVDIPKYKEDAAVNIGFTNSKPSFKSESRSTQAEQVTEIPLKNIKSFPKKKQSSAFDGTGFNADKSAYSGTKSEKHTAQPSNSGYEPEEILPEQTEKDYEKYLSALSQEEAEIFKLFIKKPILTANEIADSGLQITNVLTSLTFLEVYGYIKIISGGRYKRII